MNVVIWHHFLQAAKLNHFGVGQWNRNSVDAVELAKKELLRGRLNLNVLHFVVGDRVHVVAVVVYQLLHRVEASEDENGVHVAAGLHQILCRCQDRVFPSFDSTALVFYFKLAELLEINAEEAVVAEFARFNLGSHAHKTSELKVDDSIVAAADGEALAAAMRGARVLVHLEIFPLDLISPHRFNILHIQTNAGVGELHLVVGLLSFVLLSNQEQVAVDDNHVRVNRSRRLVARVAVLLKPEALEPSQKSFQFVVLSDALD